ncbi:MAG: hypothetical protein NTU57_01360 [Candidatus Aenigmarchaeota archaeon]|nr:hypothetical protein [Candidatus Aenigmarchaeota archaeon]
MVDKNLAESAKELDLLSISFIEELVKIKELLDETTEKSKDNKEDDEDEEYAESYGDLKEELKRYHEKLKAYEKIIKEGISEAYGSAKPEAPKKEETSKETEIVSPFDRGHKLGCGCPGCSAYRNFYGIRLGNDKDDFGNILAAKTTTKKTQNYEETASRPCGGKMFNHFHGERAGLSNALGGYTGRFSFKRAGY